MHMMSLASIKQALRNGPYAWPGGYPMYFLMCDGEALSFDAVRAEWRQVCQAHIRKDMRDQWAICAYDINWEDDTLICAHTNMPIPSAYGE